MPNTSHPQQEALQRAISIIGSATALADLLGITKGAISQWKDKGRSIPFEYGAAIETATSGAVTRRNLFPDDWQRVWPELEGQHCCISASKVDSKE